MGHLKNQARDALITELMKNRKMLFCQAMKIVRSYAAAEDVLQDSALKCLSSPPRAMPEKVGGYVSRIVRNTAVDYMRRQRLERSDTIDGEDGLLKTGSDHRCGSFCLESKDSLHSVTKALGSLPKRHQDAFLRHRLSEVPQKQIAQELSVSPTLVNFMIRDVDNACRAAVSET